MGGRRRTPPPSPPLKGGALAPRRCCCSTARLPPTRLASQVGGPRPLRPRLATGLPLSPPHGCACMRSLSPKADESAMNLEGLAQPSFERFETFLLAGSKLPTILYSHALG